MKNIALRLSTALLLLLCPVACIFCYAQQTTPAFVGSETTTLFLVRHAEKQSGSPDPELTKNGQDRAKRLANLLRSTDLAACYASQFNRTQQTARPTAATQRIEVQVHPAGQETALVKRIRNQHKGDSVLVVGHSNTVPTILRQLGYNRQVTLEEHHYDDLFVVQLRDGDIQVLHLHYGSPTVGARTHTRLEPSK